MIGTGRYDKYQFQLNLTSLISLNQFVSTYNL